MKKRIAPLLPLAVAGVLFLAAAVPKNADVVRAAPLEWGFYQILWSRAFPTQLANQIAEFASPPDYVMFFRDLPRPFPRSIIEAAAKHGTTTIVTMELTSWHSRRKGSYLGAINAGEYDGPLRSWAKEAKRYGRRVLLRFGFEFNGNWFSWCGDPVGYIAAWRRAHDIFDDAGASQVEWVWSPNVVSCPDTPENDWHHFYPGDAYVDWIGVDGYNFGDNHDRWHRWQTFAEVFDPILKGFQKRYPNKPVIISEFGCATGEPGRRAAWIRGAYHRLAHYPHVKAVVWFNYDKRREGEQNWRLTADDGSLQAFNETFAAPTQNVENKSEPPSGSPAED